MANFYSLVVSAFSKDAGAAQAVTELAKKAVRVAYSRGDDGIIMVQTMLDHMTRNYRDALPRFFKRAGFTIDIVPGRPAIVQVLDKTQQVKVFKWLESDACFVVDPEDVIKQPRAKKTPDGTWAEQASKAVEQFVARQKKANPEVGALINQMVQRPAWYAKFAALNLNDEEVQMVVDAVMAYRMEESEVRKVA